MLKKLFLSLLLMGILHAEIADRTNVTKLYIGTFNRAPDNAGLDYWVMSNLTLEEIAESFFEQSETKNLYPDNYSNIDFISSIYRNVLGREPDQEGLDYWLSALEDKNTRSASDGKISKSKFILAIVNGATGDDAILLSNKTDVGLAFANSGSNDVNEARNVLSSVTINSASVSNTLNSFSLSLYSENEQKDQERQKFVNRYISDYAQVEKNIIDKEYAGALSNIKDSVKKFSAGADFAYKLISEEKNMGVIFATTQGYMIPFIITALNLQPEDEKLAKFLAMGLIDILILRNTNNSNISSVKEKILVNLGANYAIFLGYRFTKDSVNSPVARETLDLLIYRCVYFYDSISNLKNPAGFVVTQAKLLAEISGGLRQWYLANDVTYTYDIYNIELTYLMYFYTKSKSETNSGVIDAMNSSGYNIRKDATYDEILQTIALKQFNVDLEYNGSQMEKIKKNIKDFKYRLDIFWNGYLEQEQVLSEQYNYTSYIPEPTLIYPSTYTFSPIDVDYIEFRWESVANADRYKFSLFNTTDKVSIYEGDVSDTGEIYTFKPISNLPTGKSFSWKVQACTYSLDSCSDWSEGTFQIAKKSEPQIEIPNRPSLISPERNKVIYDNNIELKWKNVDNADSYELSVSNNTDNSIVFEDRVSINSKKLSDLPVGKVYFWTVKACNSSGCSKHFIGYFATKEKEEVTVEEEIPNIPTLIYPAQKATVDNSAELKWEVVSDANSYRVSTYNYITKAYSSSMVYTNSKPVSSLASGVPFLWSVAACNNTGCSDDSSQRLVSIK